MEMDIAFGPVAEFISDKTIEEIWINSPQRIFIARAGKSELTNLILSAEEVSQLVDRLLIWSGRRLDLSHPFVDARLPDGSRLHVVIPEITAEHWTVNIRKHLMRHLTLQDLAERGALNSAMAVVLTNSVCAGLNILVSGGTQSGKTTMLNALMMTSRRMEQRAAPSVRRGAPAGRAGRRRARRAWPGPAGPRGRRRRGGSSPRPHPAARPGRPGPAPGDAHAGDRKSVV